MVTPGEVGRMLAWLRRLDEGVDDLIDLLTRLVELAERVAPPDQRLPSEDEPTQPLAPASNGHGRRVPVQR